MHTISISRIGVTYFKLHLEIFNQLKSAAMKHLNIYNSTHPYRQRSRFNASWYIY